MTNKAQRNPAWHTALFLVGFTVLIVPQFFNFNIPTVLHHLFVK